MKPHLVLLLAAVAIGCSAPAPPSATSIAPSATPSTVPSATPAPSYAYLEDVTSERTQAFVAEKNDAARRYLGALPSRPTFHAGLDRSLRVVELGVPHKARDGYHYYTRKLADRDHPILVRARVYAIERGEEVVLDPNQWSSDGKKKLSGWRLSPDEKRLAYGTSEGGSDWTTWRVLDLSQMKPLADELRGLKWSSPTWTPDGGGLLYSGYENRSHEETAPGDNNRVYHHRLGQPQSADRAVFRPADPEWMVAPYVPPHGKYAVLYLYKSSDGRGRTQLYPLPDTLPEDLTPLFAGAPPHVVSPDFAHRQWDVAHEPDALYLFSEEDAPRGRIDRYRLSTRKLETIVPEQKETLVTASRAGRYLFAKYLDDLASRVVVYDLDGKEVDRISTAEPTNLSGFDGESWSEETFFSAAGYAQPTEVRRYDLAQRKPTTLWRLGVDFDAEAFVSERVFYPGKDGTKIPMFTVRRRDVKLDGTAPTLLIGYGCYGYVLPVHFATSRLPWLDAGGIVAVANIRGGGAYGERWHLAGKKANKQTSIDDFVAAAEWLHAQGYGSPEHTAILGASCGGLLVGATATQRPDLVAAAIAEVGVLDLLRYHRFSGAFLWKDELGSAEVPEERAYLEKLSPVEAAKTARRYPAFLITTRKKDTRVSPMNSYKFAAVLADHQRAEAPVLLRVDEIGGHSSSTLPLDQRIDYLADVYAFAWSMTGGKTRPPAE